MSVHIVETDLVVTSLAPERVEVVEVGTGRLVRLPASLGAETLEALREGLLASCEGDLVVDGTCVDDAGEDALAVLVAASWWAQETGTRMLWSGLSELLASELDLLAVAVRRL